MEEPAATYTHGHHESVLRSHRWRTAANSAAYLLERLRPGMDLLDVGCGPGTITAELAAIVSPGRAHGIDTARAALAAAQGGLAEARARFALADVMELPFADGSYDVVHAHQVLQHTGDPVGALREMARVCRSGGLVAVRDADYAAMAWYPADAALDRWLALYRQVAVANGGQPDAGRRLGHWASQAGLHNLAVTASAWCFASPEERAWWGGTWAERVSHSALAARAMALGLASQEEMNDLAAAWRRWAQRDEGWFGVLHGEVIAVVP